MHAANITMAPVTPEVAKLLHALQAELLALPQQDEIPAGSIVLNPAPTNLKATFLERSEVRSLELDDRNYTYSATYSTPYIRPDWGFEHSYAPGMWLLQERRRDAKGNVWTKNAGTFIQDDFGMLVEVPR